MAEEVDVLGHGLSGQVALGVLKALHEKDVAIATLKAERDVAKHDLVGALKMLRIAQDGHHKNLCFGYRDGPIKDCHSWFCKEVRDRFGEGKGASQPVVKVQRPPSSSVGEVPNA